MARPFLVVGAMKSGTTTLELILRGLPGVSLVGEKESSAFLNPWGADLVVRRILESRAVAAGEVTTAYMQRPLHQIDTQRVAALLGQDLVIIAVLRDPFRRAVSHWRHWAQLGINGNTNLSEALLDQRGPYVAFSKYAYQLEPWLQVLGKDRVIPLRLEDYAMDPHAWLSPVCDALGVPSPNAVSPVHANAGESRVVAKGLGAQLMDVPAYRRYLRPLLPPRLRRAGALLLGGHAGGYQSEEVPQSVERSFRALVAEDTAALAACWPHLLWD